MILLAILLINPLKTSCAAGRKAVRVKWIGLVVGTYSGCTYTGVIVSVSSGWIERVANFVILRLIFAKIVNPGGYCTGNTANNRRGD